MLLVGSTRAWGQAQVPCLGIANGTLSFNDRVICTVPQLYGPQGLIFGVPATLKPPFLASAPGSFTPPTVTSYLDAVNQTITSQIASLPLVAPASGISLVLDQSLGVFVASNDSFGPIFSERASTIGKYRLALGFSYQHMNFDSLDGIDLHSFPTVFVQPDDAWGVTNFGQCNPVTNVPNCSRGSHDYLTASNRIDLHINQYTAFVTFGVTKRIDLSVAVPVLTVSMSAAADTNIVANSNVLGGLSFNTVAPHLACLTQSGPQNSQYCSEALLFNSQRSSGIGDLTVRAKGVLKSWERAALAAGLDIRVPTGDEKNFLGTGATGIRPFLVWSRGGRISPHVNLGYQWNGRSILASDIKAGAYAGDTARYYLPREVFYSAGIEAPVTKHFTATLDLVGQAVINGARVHLIEALAPGICPTTSSNPNPSDICVNAGPPVKQVTIADYKGTYAIDNASLGLRYRPFGRFLLSANVLLKVDNGGLRSKAIPTVSATYTLR
jgi:hypothetical protein